MSSPIGRAALTSLRTGNSNVASRVSEIGKRNFKKGHFSDDEDEDDDGESYSIDPSVQLWKTIDFGKGKSIKDNGSSTISTPKASRSVDIVKRINSMTLSPKASFENLNFEASPTFVQSKSVSLFTEVTPKRNKDLSRELDDLHQALDELDFDKKEIARKSKKLAQSPLAHNNSSPGITSKEELDAMALELSRQKDELKLLMTSIEKEKQEMTLKNQLREIEQRKQIELEASRMAKERQEMEYQIAAMKMENQRLINQIEKNQAESKKILDKEREERKEIIAHMQLEHSKVTEALMENQATTEEKLSKEREELRKNLKRMEQEKSELMILVQAHEDRLKTEGQQMEQQRQEFQVFMKKLEEEKIGLVQKLQAELQVEDGLRKQWEDQIASLEKEKSGLQSQLKAAESNYLESKRQTEESFKERWEIMDKEKRDVALHWAQQEKTVADQAKALFDHFDKEQEELQQALRKIEAEKILVEQRQEEVRRKRESATRDCQESSTIEGQVEDSLSLERKTLMNQSWKKELDELQQRWVEVEGDRLILLEKLQYIETSRHQRQQVLAERSVREREDLKQTVLRMKEEFQSQRSPGSGLSGKGLGSFRWSGYGSFHLSNTPSSVITPTSNNNKNNSNSNSSSTSSIAALVSSGATTTPVLLKSKKSLYQMLEEAVVTESPRGVVVPMSPGDFGAMKDGDHLVQPTTLSPAAPLQPENSLDARAKALRRILDRKIALSSTRSRSIRMIPEGDESVDGKADTPKRSSSQTQGSGKEIPSFMDLEDSEDSDSGLAELLEDMKNGKLGEDDEEDREELEHDGVVDDSTPQEDPLWAELPLPHSLAASGKWEQLLKLAEEEPSLLSSLDESNRSPLFYAVAYGRDTICRYLLEKCPQMAIVADVHGDTPLHAATSAGAPSCVEMLCQTGGALLSTEKKKEEGSNVEEDLFQSFAAMASSHNAMDMTPAHLSCSVDCLEVLYKYGADMAALDCNGRSPLFVACAMNREDCAEYLINCLDQDETSLLIKDNRGDTPLHAAACNGCVDCLLLLLQYGIDPTILNDRGLKAIDLAIKNKQHKCRELLAEYQLHYFTSSDFDSVLFWATLEGHKLVKLEAKDENYEIIRKNSVDPGASLTSNGSLGSSSSANGHGSGSLAAITPMSLLLTTRDGNTAAGSSSLNLLGNEPSSGLARIQSMFSMKNKSLRLQKWGSWIAYEDYQTHRLYWYNHETSKGQWEMPDQVLQMQQKMIAGQVDASTKGLVSKASMRLKRIGDWIQYITENGRTFYYNEKNGDFQWSHPSESKGSSKKKGSANTSSPQDKNSSKSNKLDKDSTSDNMSSKSSLTSNSASDRIESNDDSVSGQKDWEENELQQQQQQQQQHQSSLSESHSDSGNFGAWRPYTDPESGAIFWYNQITKVSQWDCPPEIQAQIDAQLEIANGNGENVTGDGLTNAGDEDEMDIFQVHDEDDLGI